MITDGPTPSVGSFAERAGRRQPGLVAVGEDESSDCGGGINVIWTSVDGFTWSRVAFDQLCEGGGVGDVTVGGPGLVAVGTASEEDPSTAAVWTSVDGLSWSRVPLDETAFGLPLGAGNGMVIRQPGAAPARRVGKLG